MRGLGTLQQMRHWRDSHTQNGCKFWWLSRSLRMSRNFARLSPKERERGGRHLRHAVAWGPSVSAGRRIVGPDAAAVSYRITGRASSRAVLRCVALRIETSRLYLLHHDPHRRPS